MNKIKKAIDTLDSILIETEDISGTERYCEAIRMGREALQRELDAMKNCKSCLDGVGTKRVCLNTQSDEYTNFVDDKMCCEHWRG